MRSISVYVLLFLTLALGLARANDAIPAETSASTSRGQGRTFPETLHPVTHEFREGETFAAILRPLGVAGAEGHAWFQAVKTQLPGGKLTGQRLYFYFAQEPAPDKARNLRAIQIQLPSGQLLSWRFGSERIHFERRDALPRAAEIHIALPASPVQKQGQPLVGAVKPVQQPRLNSVERITHVIRRGETLAGLFRSMAVPANEAAEWFRAISPKYSLKRLRPGRRVIVHLTTSAANRGSQKPGKRGLRALQIEANKSQLLTWQKEGDRIAYRGKKPPQEATAKMLMLPPAPAPEPHANGLNGNATESIAVGSLHHISRKVSKGETLAGIMKPLGVSGVESRTWFLALREHPAGRTLLPGQQIDLYFANEPSAARAGNLRAVQLRTTNETATWKLVGNHIYLGSKKVIALRSEDSTSGTKIFTGRYPGGLRKLPLSEYTLARVKQRNGLRAHLHAQTGHRPTASLKNLKRITKKLAPGGSLLGVLKPYGLSQEEQQEWLQSIQRNYAAEQLQSGTAIHVYFASKEEGTEEHDVPVFGPLKALEIELAAEKILTWYRSDHGILFYKSEPRYDVEIKAVTGTIGTGSLYDAAARVGLHPAAVEQLVDIFGWDINFETDLRRGDTFRVLYTRKFVPESREPSQVRVLAAQMVNGGETHMAIYFENANGKGDYYDLQGRSVSRSFLRYPVEFRRISSSFSRRRYHPILRVRKPHRGVDFAARRRTPVKTIGDGTVTYAAWKGAYGRFVEIDHGAGLKTRYAHLHRIARGVRPGARVQKGQLIGTVGCSGRCTGPHLHFEMWENDRYINPLKPDLPPDDELDPTVFKIFEEAKASFLTKLTDAPGAPSAGSGERLVDPGREATDQPS